MSNPKTPKGFIKHNGYSSKVCEHHLDIVTCPECNIFGQPYTVRFEGKKRDILKDPIGYLKIRWSIRQFAKRNKGTKEKS